MKIWLPSFLAAAALLSGCGYFLAGEWHDDPANWKRAFGTPTPHGVNVRHSYHVRMPHFTKEWSYHFEPEDSKASREAIGLHAFLQNSYRTAVQLPVDPGWPDWFLKEIPPDSEVWEYPGADEFFAVIDRVRGRIYIHDQQF